MKLTAIDRWADAAPGFNTAAADAVYKSMAGMDEDSALVYGRILLAGGVHYEMCAHRDQLAKAAGALVEARAGALRRRYTRTAVAKARAGQDNTAEITALVAIAKAAPDFDFTAQQRHQYTQARHRGEGGRFVAEHHRIDTDPTRSPLPRDYAAKSGIPDATTLEGRDLAHYQQAYGQIRDLLAPFHHPDQDALLHLNVQSRNGAISTHQLAVKEAPSIAGKLTAGDRIETASVSVHPKAITGPTAGFDLLSALTNPRVAGHVQGQYHGGALDTPRLKQFNEARLRPDENEAFSPAGAALGSLARGSKLLQDGLGEQAPRKLQYALAVANHVGQYGPEAQKVFGPPADRAAYRYRGTERALDPKLKGAFMVLRNAGYKGAEARDAAVVGLEGKRGEGWEPGAVLRYFRNQLPDPDLNELQRRSGVIPPSEGIIIGPTGTVAHQSVGYADDWYLPFNLRHLSALKGGDYIRTRTFGGPTTEDVYTGLMSGAKSMTVVSHNGAYTVEFDKNLRGGRRFNDKATRMVARYGQLLDAVRSDQVSRGGISSSRMAELSEKVRTEYEPDEGSASYRRRLDQLVSDERRNPTLSRADSAAAADEWLASATADLREGRPMSTAEMVGKLIDAKGKADFLADKARADQMGVAQPHTQAQFREQARAQIETGTPTEQIARVAELMHQSGEFNRAMDRAADANAGRVRSLKLDGAGYNAALMALQEQFPYYIDKVTYHPWKEARGIGGVVDRTLEGARDTGYVAPRFNRPQAAEAGYFNTDVIAGQGKVQAQSTRYQNYRQGQGRLVPVGQRADKDTAGGKTAATRGTTAGVDEKELQHAADLAMLDELLAKDTFAEGAKVSGIDVSGLNIKTEASRSDFPNPAIRRLFKPGARSELAAADDLHGLLEQILAMAEGPDKLFAVPAAKTYAFKNKGKQQAPGAVPTSLATKLREVDKDHEFGGIAFDPLRPATLEAIANAYAGDSPISRLTASGELPPITDPDFDTKTGALRQRLDTASGWHLRQEQIGGRGDPARMMQDQRDADALLRATQLRRRYDDTVKNLPPPPAPAPPVDAGGTTTYENRVMLAGTPAEIADLTDEQMTRYIANSARLVGGGGASGGAASAGSARGGGHQIIDG